MTLQNIIDTMISYGYFLKDELSINIGWSIKQKFDKVENPTDKYDRVLNFTWEEKYPQGINSDASFILWETESVSSNGIMYEDAGRLYYFYSFGSHISRIYQDTELDILLQDIHKDICDRMETDGLRNIKLTNILNENIHA